MIGAVPISMGLILVATLSLSSNAAATTGSVANVGPLLTQGEYSTATREWVDLTSAGSLLVGKPHHDLVELITISAPGATDSNLILRELTTRDGHRTLLLTVPEDIDERVARATIYFRGLPANIRLFEQFNGTWKERQPQALTVPSDAPGETNQMLLAFSVQRLGFYWLSDPTAFPSLAAANAGDMTSAHTLMGKGPAWAFAPSLLGLGLFFTFGLLSRWVHRAPRILGSS